MPYCCAGALGMRAATTRRKEHAPVLRLAIAPPRPLGRLDFPLLRVDAGAWSVAFRASGPAPTVLAIHGLGGSSQYWRDLARRLPDGAALVAPDLLGFGHSDKPSLEYTAERQVEALAAVVHASGLPERFALVGHSLGGALAVELAARLPGRVSRLALVAAPLMTGDVSARRDGRTCLTRLRVQRRLLGLLLPVYTRVRGGYGPYPREVVEDFGRYAAHAYLSTLDSAIWGHDYRPALAAVRSLPAYLLYGEADRMVPPANGAAFRRAFREAQLHLVPGDHQVLLTNPDAADALARWLVDGSG